MDLSASQCPCLLVSAAALPHVPGSPRLGVLRRLRPVPTRSVNGEPNPCSAPAARKRGEDRNGSHVHCCSLDGGRRPTLSLRPRHGYAVDIHHDLPAGASRPAQKLFPPGPNERPTGCAPLPAHIRQIAAGRYLRDVITRVPRVLLPITLAEPEPSGSAGPFRLCQGCSHPRPAPSGAGCPQLHRPATTGSAVVVSHLHSNISASRRTDALIKLSVVVSDPFGATGRPTMAALTAGERDRAGLPDLARGSLRSTTAGLTEALAGRFTDHHAFLLTQMLHRVDAVTA